MLSQFQEIDRLASFPIASEWHSVLEYNQKSDQLGCTILCHRHSYMISSWWPSTSTQSRLLLRSLTIVATTRWLVSLLQSATYRRLSENHSMNEWVASSCRVDKQHEITDRPHKADCMTHACKNRNYTYIAAWGSSYCRLICRRATY